MNRRDLINSVAARFPMLELGDIRQCVKLILARMEGALADGERIEIRDFGVFYLKLRTQRPGRNPRTGEPVLMAERYLVRFKPGKALRERVDATLAQPPQRIRRKQSDGGMKDNKDIARKAA